jgi:hypothetical protein
MGTGLGGSNPSLLPPIPSFRLKCSSSFIVKPLNHITYPLRPLRLLTLGPCTCHLAVFPDSSNWRGGRVMGLGVVERD